MNQIVYPMFALVVLTMIVGMILGMARYKGIVNREVKPSYFKTFTGEPPPEHQIQLTRNFNNLFEVPLLFYIVCVLILILNIESMLLLILAWAYVVLRVVHSYIHTTYNMPIHRLIAFLSSNLIVSVMWIMVIINLSL